MRTLLKVLLGIAALFVLLLVGAFAYVSMSWEKSFDTPYPDLQASTDSAVIARGRHLAQGPAHCSSCHVPTEELLKADYDVTQPLAGGWSLSIPPGTFRAPNLTPDMETGIGEWTDGEIARALRHGVKHDNHLLFPFMEFQNMSDEDVIAILSFLRSQEPVRHEVPPSEYSFLGKALVAFGLIKPLSPEKTPPARVPEEASAVYGSYLSNHVANCNGCHTNRDLKTGKFIGEPFAGGMLFSAEDDPLFSKGYSFISPNLTPDPETGVLAKMDEDLFVARFQAGRLVPNSPMPWEAYALMNETELRAMYRYLQTLKPVNYAVPRTVIAPGEEIAMR